METIELRQSAIAAASCLKRYHEIYELGLEENSDEARRGSAFHRIALEEYIPRLVQLEREQDADELSKAFQRGIVASHTPAHLIREVEDIVFRWGINFRLDLEAFMAAEQRQRGDGYTWKPDLTFAHQFTPRGSVLRVEDLKTYWAILDEDAVRREFQGQFYIWRAMQAWPGFDVYEFAMTFVRYGVTVPVEYTPEDLESLERRVKATLATIEDARQTGDWPAQPGEHCGFCRLECDVADDPRVLDRRILSAEEASIVAGRVLVLRRMLKSDETTLRTWTMTEGPARAGAMEFAHRPSDRLRWPVPLVLAECAKAEITPPRFECGKTILRPLIGTKRMERSNPELVTILRAAARSESKTKFSAKKLGNMAPDDENGEEEGGDHED